MVMTVAMHGEVPVRRQVEVLAASGYKGCYSFEWEKVWHPDLEEPEIAFEDYAEFMRKIHIDHHAYFDHKSGELASTGGLF